MNTQSMNLWVNNRKFEYNDIDYVWGCITDRNVTQNRQTALCWFCSKYDKSRWYVFKVLISQHISLLRIKSRNRGFSISISPGYIRNIPLSWAKIPRNERCEDRGQCILIKQTTLIEYYEVRKVEQARAPDLIAANSYFLHIKCINAHNNTT